MNDAESLLKLLPERVVLLRWPLGSKGTKRYWGHLTADHMTPGYLKKLDGSNIGVAVGKVSNDLIAIDIDEDDLVEPFIEANPWLKDTLQTHGARGCVFWLQMTGRYPAKTIKLKSSSSDDCGEWRAGKNSQSIIHGKHPSGNTYIIVNEAKVQRVDFADIIWPSQIMNPPTLKSELPALEGVKASDLKLAYDVKSYRRDRGTEDPDDPEESEEVGDWLFVVQSVEDVLRLATPTSVHQNYHLALVLARGVKALEIQGGKKFTPQEHSEIHNRWLKLAKNYLRHEQSESDYFMEYLNAYRLAKFPLGSIALQKALEAARKNPLPDSVLPWIKDPDVRLVAALCRELQAQNGKEPLYLSGRSIQRIFKHPNHAKGASWMGGLCVMGVLKLVKKGSGNRSSRYFYLL